MRTIISSSLILLITVSLCFSQSSPEANAQQDAFLTQLYDVYPWVADKIKKPEDWKSILGAMGVPWPEGSSIVYFSELRKLVVMNTQANLSIFEGILKELNKMPAQVEVEVRFIEVEETDVVTPEAEWMLTDEWIKDDGKFATNELKTSGARVTVASALTEPELVMMINALQSKGHADLLSALRITTTAGKRGTIKVVKEYTYATEATVEQVTATNKVNGGDTEETGTLVVPGGFETRDVGVSLSVLPTVDDKQEINLDMKFEVVDEPTWQDYKAIYTAADGTEKQLALPQPFFPVHGIENTISVYNGGTVILGGMVTEKKTQVEKRTPVLGRIPLIGRAFRRTEEQTEIRQLLIFVTARIVKV